MGSLAGAWLIVPLPVGGELVGFVVLLNPRSPVEVDWEVRDLLKATAPAAAAYLQQLRVSEALIESRKFDAFNRMSAFVVHDLKNLVAQLSLMLRNAERHRDNPAFQRDMLETVAHVVERMNALMLQLRAGTTPIDNARPVELEALVRRVAAAKGRARFRPARPRRGRDGARPRGAARARDRPPAAERARRHPVGRVGEAWACAAKRARRGSRSRTAASA